MIIEFFTLLLLLNAISAKIFVHENVRMDLQKSNAAFSNNFLFGSAFNDCSIEMIITLKEVQELPETKEDIYFKLKNAHSTAQANFLKNLKKVATSPIKVMQQFTVTNTLILEGDENILNAIEQLTDEIVSIYSNRLFNAKIVRPVETSVPEDVSKHSFILENNEEVQWNVKWVNAHSVWSKSKGEGAIYANADTGVQWDHPVLKESYLGLKADGTVDHNYAWWDAVKKPATPTKGPCGINSQVPCDDTGHGTHTLSTTVGSNGIGGAPEAKWMACRNMDQGFGSSSMYLSCLEFFMAPTDLSGKNPRPELRPYVIGNSYGCPPSEGCARHAFSAAMKNLQEAGIFMSVSAGNEGPSCSTISDPPAIEDYSFTVAASNYQSYSIASFSSRGPISHSKKGFTLGPMITAPGVRVYGAYPRNSYRSLSGTSMASPLVGSAVLLLWSICERARRNIGLTKGLLQYSATPIYPTNQLCGNDTKNSSPNNIYGFGMLDILLAVEKCLEQ